MNYINNLNIKNIKNIKFSITAIASLLHRLSGIMLFITINILILLLKISLSSCDNFLLIKIILNNTINRFILNLMLILLIYHILNGIWQIFTNLGLLTNKTLKQSKINTIFIFFITTFFFIIIKYFFY